MERLSWLYPTVWFQSHRRAASVVELTADFCLYLRRILAWILAWWVDFWTLSFVIWHLISSCVVRNHLAAPYSGCPWVLIPSKPKPKYVIALVSRNKPSTLKTPNVIDALTPSAIWAVFRLGMLLSPWKHCFSKLKFPSHHHHRRFELDL